MTKQMERVIARVTALSEKEREYYATIFLEKLEDDRKWDESFASTQDQLAKLADEALQEFEKGKTTPLDISSRRK